MPRYIRIRIVAKHFRVGSACPLVNCALLNVASCLVLCLTVAAQTPASDSPAAVSGAATTIAVPPSSHAFRIRSYLSVQANPPIGSTAVGKCIDYGTPVLVLSLASVFLNSCSAAHPIVVQELNNDRHEVILHAGNFIMGIPRIPVNQIGSPAAAAVSDRLLRLFSPLALLTGTVDAVFAFDGDSIILASSRCSSCASPPTQSVVKLQRGRSDNRTPLVVGPRNLADSEFWDFLAADGSVADPTSGFIRVSDRNTLLIAMYRVNQIAQQNNGAAWGSVIEIVNTGEPIDMSLNPASTDSDDSRVNGIHNLVIPTGTTIRGDRRGTNPGPLLLGLYNQDDPQPGTRLMQIDGDYVRITGLRLQGPSGNEDTWPDTIGILIGDPIHSIRQPVQTMIDRNELFNWPTVAIGPSGASSDQDCLNGQPGTFNTDTNVFKPGPIGSVFATLITHNFIHDNQEHGLGYGVAVGRGAGASVLGNVFSFNRHAVTSDDNTANQYLALDNLVLSQRPVYCGLIICKPEQDFDVHGTLSLGGQHDGGFAGYNAEIAWNTFIGGGNFNFDLRGEPCKAPDYFFNNNSGADVGDAFEAYDFFGVKDHPTSSTANLSIFGNTWNAVDPTTLLGVGDFDGDGVADLFLATGTTWFYSPGATAEWRFLNGGRTDRMQSLLLGDFDGDGRTDVVGMNGANLMVSWGGISNWEVLNSLPGVSLSDMAVGDFDGDGRSDILFADGTNWYVSSGGSGPFQFVNTSSFRVNNLRFGHFHICGNGGETDVFGIVGGKWQVTCGARNDWIPLPVSLTANLTNLYVADFDGDGNADVAVASVPNVSGGQLTRWPWQFSHNGAEAFTTNIVSPTASCPDLANAPADRLLAGIGQFGGNSSSDILIWGGNKLCIIPAGVDEAQLQSRQLMR